MGRVVAAIAALVAGCHTEVVQPMTTSARVDVHWANRQQIDAVAQAYGDASHPNRTGYAVLKGRGTDWSCAVYVLPPRDLERRSEQERAAVVAALAALAAVVSAGTGQRVVELQEDALAPNPVPAIDMRSRKDGAQELSHGVLSIRARR